MTLPDKDKRMVARAKAEAARHKARNKAEAARHKARLEVLEKAKKK